MAHCDPDVLALVALGDLEPSALERDHLATCAQCRDELEGLADVAGVARSAAWAVEAGGVALQSPPDAVWQRIRDVVADPDPPAQLQPRRRRGWAITLLAAACLAAIAGSFVLGRSMTQAPAGVPVARASLEALPGETSSGQGTAVLLRRDGSYAVEVDTRDLPSAQGFYEVWLINPADSGLVSLGTISANQASASLPVPAGLPVSAFSVVDISDEPFDGNPAHSKVSVLRGQFEV